MSVAAKPTFWKPGSAPPPPTGSSSDRTSEHDSTLFLPPSSSPSSPPIHSSRLSILHALESSPILLLLAPTGSGKSTQLPQYLLSSGWSSSSHGIIAVTQPRRLAATSLAARVASEISSPLGSVVGYSIRFEELTSPATKIKFLTDGMLFRELLKDPLLTRYSVVVVDEAHERSVWTDLLLGVLRKVLRKRPELRVVVSSATIDVGVFKDFFEEGGEERVKAIQLEGRSFPVHTAYLHSSCQDYIRETVETIWRIHLTEPRGTILAFLTGREEIESALQMLSDRQSELPEGAAKMFLLPLHSGLTADEQGEIFSPTPASQRKVVVATNIAEASITLDGIVYVVDCGLVKLRTLSPTTGIESLSVVPISKASAAQRAGRAGRTRPGKCFRLYTEHAFHNLPPSTPPELTRTDLSTPILLLKSLGIDNLAQFEWVPPAPPPALLAAGLEKLFALGAIDEHTRLTPLGTQMADLPLPPHLGKILLSSTDHGCASEILSILAMTQVTTPFYAADSPQTQLSMRSFTATQGDLFTLLNIFLAFTTVGKRSAKWASKHRLNFRTLSRAISIRNQLEKYLLRFKLDRSSSVLGKEGAVEKLSRVVCSGLYDKLARYDESTMTYKTVCRGNGEGREVWVHPTSVLFNRRPEKGKVWVVYGEATEQGDGGKTYIRDLTVLDDLSWVTEAVPGYYDVKTQFGRSTSSAVYTSGSGGVE